MRNLYSNEFKGIHYPTSDSTLEREQLKHELRQQEHFSFGNNLQRIEPEERIDDDVWGW